MPIPILLFQTVDDLEQAFGDAGITAKDIALALAVLLFTWIASIIAGRFARRFAKRTPWIQDNLPDFVIRGPQTIVWLLGVGLALSVLGLDVGWVSFASIAVIIVLMIRPLIENTAAGLLLQARPSFSVGDEIELEDFTGEVLEINARSTVLRTRDWRRIHIPNMNVLSEAIVVYTAFDRRRSSIELDIEYGSNVQEVRLLLESAAANVEGVLTDPPPYARARQFGAGTYRLSLRWWHEASLSAGSRSLDGVVEAVKSALDGAGIDMPSPEYVIRRANETSDHAAIIE